MIDNQKKKRHELVVCNWSATAYTSFETIRFCFQLCFAWYLDRSWNSLPELSSAMHDGKENMAHGDPHERSCAVCGDNLAKINMIYHFYGSGQLEYSSINKMAK